ncbi:transporter associated domain-containing protein [Treponema sp.]|uniref:transporter associated domain-containing protein n=1 Tax=Treponema sp. TaxID=166 RepID=UPI003FA22E27
MKQLRAQFNKQNLRRYLGLLASYTEILLALVVIVGILILSIRVLSELKTMIIGTFTGAAIPSFSQFLSMVFELVIGIEFVKMLAKHTPGSAIEVLLYTIARALIIDHSSMTGALLGVISIAILFAVRKYFNDPEVHNHETGGDYIVNGGISMKEVNKRLDADFDESYGHTVAGYLFNYLKAIGKEPTVGCEVHIGEYSFQVYDMEEDLIRYIKITPRKS